MKKLWQIVRAWEMARDNPGKKIRVLTADGMMVLTFDKSEGFGGKEIGEIDIDGEKQCPQI